MHSQMRWGHKGFGHGAMQIPMVPAPAVACGMIVGMIVGIVIGKQKAMMHGMGGGMMYGMPPGEGPWMAHKQKMMGMGGMPGHHHHAGGAPCWCGQGEGEASSPGMGETSAEPRERSGGQQGQPSRRRQGSQQ